MALRFVKLSTNPYEVGFERMLARMVMVMVMVVVVVVMMMVWWWW